MARTGNWVRTTGRQDDQPGCLRNRLTGESVPRIVKTFNKRLNYLHYPGALFTQTAMSMASSLGPSGIMTIGEVGDCLKVTERTNYRLAAAKKIPSFQVGGSWGGIN